MSSDAFHGAKLEFAWGLWTELGIPGVVRPGLGVAVDPEPLLVWSAKPILADPRLRDLVSRWCQQHGEMLSASRLRGLLRGVPSANARAFGSLAATLRRTSNLRWPNAVDTEPQWPAPEEAKDVMLPMRRPALLRFRLRALAGVGTRADVLCELLASAGSWVSAGDLASQGYTKRNVARVLSELDDAGISRSIPKGNSRRFQLADAATLSNLVGATDLVLPRWVPLLQMLALLDELFEQFGAASQAVQRVEAHKARSGVAELAASLRLQEPPPTNGNPQAYESIATWAVDQAKLLAAFTSPALCRR